MEKNEKEPKTYCMNCKYYDLEYFYCKNKESDYYQVEMPYDCVCEEYSHG